MNAILFLLYQELEIHVEKSNTHKDSVRSHDSEWIQNEYDLQSNDPARYGLNVKIILFSWLNISTLNCYKLSAYNRAYGEEVLAQRTFNVEFPSILVFLNNNFSINNKLRISNMSTEEQSIVRSSSLRYNQTRLGEEHTCS